MNLDIRNLDKDFEEAIEEIKAEFDEINTNTKAVKLATLEFLNYKNRCKELEEKAKKIESEYKETINELDVFFEVQNNLKRRVSKAEIERNCYSWNNTATLSIAVPNDEPENEDEDE